MAFLESDKRNFNVIFMKISAADTSFFASLIYLKDCSQIYNIYPVIHRQVINSITIEDLLYHLKSDLSCRILFVLTLNYIKCISNVNEHNLYYFDNYIA